MNESAEQSAGWKLDAFLRSDLLPHLLGLIQAFPSLRPLFPQILQVRVVIDANIVQGELRWRLKSRKRKDARSALQEVLACGILVAYAPHFLEEEIIEHAPRIAAETRRTLEEVLLEWEDLRAHIFFYTAQAKAEIDVSRADPDDVPYIDTMEQIAAQAIYTRDRDFLRTTTPVILITIEDVLQRYARASAVRIGVIIGSSVSVGFGLEALIALGAFLRKLIQAARRLPPTAQVLILGAITAAVVHPKSRAKLLQLWDSLNRNLKPAVWEAVVEGMYQFVEATSITQESYQAVQNILPPSRRRPLIMHVRAVCLAARKPLALDEIVMLVIANGYKPRSDRPHGYLLAKLRADERFRETESGWIIEVSRP